MSDSLKTMTLAAFALVMLSSCMPGPTYRRPAVPSTSAFKEPLPAGWKNAQPEDENPRHDWWAVFHDTALNALEEQVAISNQNVLQAEAQFRAASAAVSVARSAQFPTLTGAVSASVAGTGATSAVHQNLAIPVNVTYQADVWGSIRRTVAANTAIAQASGAQLESARLLFQSELAEDYFQLLGLDAQERLLDATVQSYEQFVQLTQDRYEGGVASMGDVALAQTQLDTARAQRIDLGVQRADFEHAVAVLTGKPPADVSIAQSTEEWTGPEVPVEIPSALLERRPDIAAAEREMAAANEEIGIAESALYPTLTLAATGGAQSAVVASLLSWPTRFWSAGPQLAGIIFDAGKRKAQIRETEADYDASVANYRQTVLTAFQQVEDSLAELRIYADEAQTIDTAVKSAQRSLEISTTQYRSGTTNYLQVIDSQTSVLQNQRTAVEILTKRMVASVSLIEALGGGWDASQLPPPSQLK